MGGIRITSVFRIPGTRLSRPRISAGFDPPFPRGFLYGVEPRQFSVVPAVTCLQRASDRSRRRPELLGIVCGDVERVLQDNVVPVRRGKTDQEGPGRKVGIP